MPALIDTDNFNRVENPLSTGWGPMANIADRGKADGANGVGSKVAGDSFAVRTATYGADQFSEVVLAVAANDSGPMVRGIDSGGSGQGYLYDISQVQSAIFKMTGTSFAQMGAAFAGVQTVGHTYYVQATGQSTVTVAAYDDGVRQTTRADASSPYTSGKPTIFFKALVCAWASWRGGELRRWVFGP